jgi:hypothetical protein
MAANYGRENKPMACRVPRDGEKTPAKLLQKWALQVFEEPGKLSLIGHS